MQERITIRLIQERVAEHYGMTVEAMLAPSRKREFSFPRSVAMYLARELTWHSLREIGAAFKRDHKVVAPHVENVKGWRQRKPGVDHDIAIITQRLFPTIHTSMDTFGGEKSAHLGTSNGVATSPKKANAE